MNLKETFESKTLHNLDTKLNLLTFISSRSQLCAATRSAAVFSCMEILKWMSQNIFWVGLIYPVELIHSQIITRDQMVLQKIKRQLVGVLSVGNYGVGFCLGTELLGAKMLRNNSAIQETIQRNANWQGMLILLKTSTNDTVLYFVRYEAVELHVLM